MDDNAVNPTVQGNPIPAQNPVVQDPTAQPVSQPQVQQQVPMSPVQAPPASQPVQPAGESPRITLEDLYGPSQPHELNQAVTQQPPTAMPAEPVVPPQAQQTPEQPAPTPPVPEVVQPTPVPESPRRMPESQKDEIPLQPVAKQVEQPVQTPEKQKESLSHNEEGGHSGGLHFPSILKFIVGGVILLIVIFVIWGISSLIFSGNSQGGGKADLVYWGLWEDKSVMQPILDDFHKQHPDITVTYTKQDPKDYTKRLLTRMQDGSGPDVFRIHNTWVYPLQSILLPLPSSVIDSKQLQTNYPPVVVQDVVNNGAVYALPLQVDTLSLFVNTDIFTHAGASVPATWDNFITVAKALTVKDPNGKIQTAGASLGTYDNIQHAPDIISLLLLQNGADPQKLSNQSNASDALSFYTSFAHGDGNVWDSTLDNSLLAFERGKLAMYFGYSYDILAIQAANPDLKFSVHPVPHLPGRDMTIASYWAEAVSNRSKHQKEAIELMQYLSQKDVQAKIYTEEAKTRAFGEIYARSDLAQTLTANTLLAPFVSQAKTAVSSIFEGDTDYDEYNGALNQYLGNAINSILKDTSVSSALTTLGQGVTQVLNNYAPSAK